MKMEKEINKKTIKQEYHIYYLRKKQEGMSYAQNRSELSSQDLMSHEISEVIKGIDNEILRLLNVKERNRKAYDIIFFGLFMFLVGLSMTISVYFFAIELFNSTLLPLSLLAGIFSTMFVGLAQLRKLKLNYFYYSFYH